MSGNIGDECKNDLVYGHTTLIGKEKNEKKVLKSLVASSGRISSLARS